MDDRDEPGIGSEERESVRQYYEHLTPAERRSRILLVPAYRDAYNGLVQAHRTVEQPAYFWERWVPELGPVAAVLYMKLRQYCFYRADAAGSDDVCWPKQDTLGQDIGVRCRERLRAALELLERHGFIERIPSSRLDERSGRPIRTADRYRVFFEIPLRSEDAAELLIRSVHQLPLGLDCEKAGIPPNGAQGQKAGIPPFGGMGHDEKAGIPPFGSVEKAGIPPFGDEPETRAQGQKAGIPPFRSPQETRAQGQMAGIPPFREQPSQKAGIPLAEVNVQRIQRSTLSRRDSRLFEESPAAALAEQLAEDLADQKSLKWYRLVADKMPENIVRFVLSDTRDALATGRLRGPAGAYFTAAIRRQALELEIEL